MVCPNSGIDVTEEQDRLNLGDPANQTVQLIVEGVFVFIGSAQSRCIDAEDGDETCS
ncbi:hypothetical protein DPMN_077431 [Dreissena polymorpha]|uniref:Uncharacterized protein n=1 Tax=Dreissena polymorpha TaxID=45954 RepID=A0A9D3YPA3_DREPO|nr:hypothetical protein DPMN_077431 [Dreissena polymorpha]